MRCAGTWANENGRATGVPNQRSEANGAGAAIVLQYTELRMHWNRPVPSVKRGHTFNVLLLELGDAVRAQHLCVHVRVRV